MVYKKYVKKKGRSFGPYYYESYREGNSVRKRYIGNYKDYQNYLRNKSFVEQPENPKKPVKMKIIAGVLFFLILFFIFGFLVFNGNINISISEKSLYYLTLLKSPSKITGLVSEEIYYDKPIDLEIKSPPIIGETVLTGNKNKRMDFTNPNENIRLYFDLLNYSEFVENIGKTLVEENIVEKTEIIKESKEENNENITKEEGKEEENKPDELNIENISNKNDEINNNGNK